MNVTLRVAPVWAILFLVTAAHAGFSWNTALSCGLSVAVLTAVATATSATGWPLVWMLFSLDFGISWVNTLDEATLFHVVTPRAALRALVYGAIVSLMIAALLVFVLKRLREETPAADGKSLQRSGVWTWKLLAGAAIYVVFYFIAGFFVYPFIQTFYAGRWLPSTGELCIIQLFRGLFYIAVALPFLRRMAGRRLHAAVVLGLCFSVLGGVAPLLLPNPYMPGRVRMAHSIEVGVSNFIFGLIVAFLLVSRRWHGGVLDPENSPVIQSGAIS
jgi:hypothetical protein